MTDLWVATWTCEICGEALEQRADGKLLRPAQVHENCRFKNFSVGDQCIAYRDPSEARELAKGLSKQARCGIVEALNPPRPARLPMKKPRQWARPGLRMGLVVVSTRSHLSASLHGRH